MLKVLKGRLVQKVANTSRKLWEPYTIENPPGVQVIVSAYNCAPMLPRFLQSLERAMRGFRWVFLAADDGSADETYAVLKAYVKTQCTADEHKLQRFKKAANVSVAKNRVVRMGFPYREKYPAIALCDADDEVGEQRISGLLEIALREGSLSLAGDFLRERGGERILHKAAALTYGPPMTLFHEALLPWDGTLFDETFHNHGDWAQQAEWRSRGIFTRLVDGLITNIHVYHPLSVSNNLTETQITRRAEKLEGFKAQLEKRKLISFCTTCMGRLHHLKQTLLANMEVCRDMPDVEFCLVNYNSQDGMDAWVKTELGEQLKSGRLRYVHTMKPKQFKMGVAKNMAHVLGTGMFLVNVDADNFLTPEYVQALRSEIAAGGEVIHFPSDDRAWGGGFGRVAVRADLFRAVGGYDEEHSGWGAEDWDLVQRAQRMSRRALRLLDPHVLSYIDHDDEERLKHMDVKNKHANNKRWHKYFIARLERGELVVNKGKQIGVI
ncbi:MAG TPA: glycosyltransferase [Verrucomicrobiae bacterium]